MHCGTLYTLRLAPIGCNYLDFSFETNVFLFFFFLKRIIHQVLAYALNFVWNCLCSSIFLCGNAKVKKFRYRKLFMEINENKNDQDLMNFSILLRLSFIACILDCIFAVFIYAYFGFSTIVLKTLTLITPCNLHSRFVIIKISKEINTKRQFIFAQSRFTGHVQATIIHSIVKWTVVKCSSLDG